MVMVVTENVRCDIFLEKGRRSVGERSTRGLKVSLENRKSKDMQPAKPQT